MKSVLLIGLGRFGKNIAIQLNKLGHDVLGVDHNEDRVNEAMDIVTDAQIGDSTNEEFLRSLGVNNFDICYVTISNDFQSSLETTYLLKELGVPSATVRSVFSCATARTESSIPKSRSQNGLRSATAPTISSTISSWMKSILSMRSPCLNHGSVRRSSSWISEENIILRSSV